MNILRKTVDETRSVKVKNQDIRNNAIYKRLRIQRRKQFDEHTIFAEYYLAGLSSNRSTQWLNSCG